MRQRTFTDYDFHKEEQRVDDQQRDDSRLTLHCECPERRTWLAEDASVPP
jgi:hypothetical protein